MQDKFKPGFIFDGRFRVEKLHSEDALGAFWDAVETDTGRPVTLRLLAGDSGFGLHEAQAAEAPLEAARALSHPSIVVPHELVGNRELTVAVSRRIAGRSLHDLRQDHPSKVLDPEDLEPTALALIEAMEHAHAQKVFHGALRPDLIFVDDQGRVQIADFGIGGVATKAVLADTGSRARGFVVPFVSHSLESGNGPYLTDDVYAFGATLYVSLTGANPLETGKARWWSKQELPATPALINERRAHGHGQSVPVSSAWEQAVLSCLDRDGFARPQRFSAIARLLGLAPAQDEPSESTVNGNARIEHDHETVRHDAQAILSRRRESVAVRSGSAVQTPSSPRVAAGNTRSAFADEFWGEDDLARRTVRTPQAPAAATPMNPPPTRPKSYLVHEKTPQKRKSGWLLRFMIAALAVAMLGIAVYYAWLEREHRALRDLLVQRIENLPSDPTDTDVARVQAVLNKEQPKLRAETWTELNGLMQRRVRLAGRQFPASDPLTGPPVAGTGPAKAPPTASTTDTTGGLTVRTLPIGAIVRIGKGEPQAGPVLADGIPVGQVEVTVSADGYATRTATAEIVRGETRNIDVALTRSVGTVRISSSTLGLPFEIASLPSGQALKEGVTPQEIELPTGDYSVSFSPPDRPSFNRPITVATDEQAILQVDYTPPPTPAPRKPAIVETRTPPAVANVAPGSSAQPAERVPSNLPVGESPSPRPLSAETTVTKMAATESAAPRTTSNQASPIVEAVNVELPKSTGPTAEEDKNPTVAKENDDSVPVHIISTSGLGSETPTAAEPAASAPGPDKPGAASVAGRSASEAVAAAEAVIALPASTILSAPANSKVTAAQTAVQVAEPVITLPASTILSAPALPSIPASAPASTPPSAAVTARAPGPQSVADLPREPSFEPAAASIEPPTIEPASEPPPFSQPVTPQKDVDFNRIFTLDEVDEKPTILERLEPRPQGRFKRVDGVVGRVRLDVIINRDGYISSARVLDSTDEKLSRACIEAVLRWRCSPAEIQDRPVAVRAVLPFVFK